jgi:hypothetical protein
MALTLSVGLIALPIRAPGAGVVTNASLSSLLAAMEGGGTVSFAATGTVAVTSTIVVSTDTVLIDLSHSIVISARSNTPVQLFKVNAGVQFSITGLTLANGSSTNGGAIYNSGTLKLTDCVFSNNIASGESGAVGRSGSFGSVLGTSGGSGRPGLAARGGAILNLGDSIIRQCTFTANQVVGGPGGAGGSGGQSNYQGGPGGDGAKGGPGIGGAIYSAGFLQISDTLFELNMAHGGNGGIGGTNGFPSGISASGNGGAASFAAGGAVYADGSGSISGSTFWGNRAIGGITADSAGNTSHFTGLAGQKGTDSFGGALYNAGAYSLVNSTFCTNIVFAGVGGKGGNGNPYRGDGGDGGNAWGGNCFNRGTLSVTNCTFAAGAAHPGLGGSRGSGAALGNDGSPGMSLGDNIVNNGGLLILKNTLLASPVTSANTHGTITDGMNNLSSDDTPLSFPTAQRNVDPLLLPLSNNGGLTPTMAISAGSPAVDAGDCTSSPLVDQRGYPRDGGCDVGAFEFQVSSSPPPLEFTVLGGQLSLSWPATATDHTLWSALNLTPPIVWQPITNAVKSKGSLFNWTTDITNRNQFFRLR